MVLAPLQGIGTYRAGAKIVGDSVTMRGTFTRVYSAGDPERNLASGTAGQITLDGRTGEVMAVS